MNSEQYYLKLVFNIPVRKAYTYSSPTDIPIGCRVQASLGKRRLTGWVTGHTDSPPPEVKSIKTIEKAIDTKPLFNEEMLKLAQWLSELTLSSLGEVISCMIPGGRRETRTEYGELDDSEDDTNHAVTELTEDQKTAVQTITDQADGWFYLFGGTGSGKTEVFLQVAEKVLESGRDIIYLVPEIALSHHLVRELTTRFAGNLAVLHSGLTPSRRLSEWRNIQSGKARFVIGARSAVFAPVNNLGIIIIDEEHESSYKSSSRPRYNARQVSMYRCRKTKAALLMGSATPSAEAWTGMKNSTLTRLKLTGRPAGGGPPHTTIVDMRKQSGILSDKMIESLSRVMAEKRQALLFLNRRGFSYFYTCMNCGEGLLCRNCSVPLTYHKNRKTMLCHYCGYKTSPKTVCQTCGSTQMQVAGFGTEKIEEDVRRLFPEKRIIRLDADSTQRKGILFNTLRDFRAGKVDILLGTQMVAKGLNAPGVKLAVILCADLALNLPDFRAAERAFALIVQVAGRVGRFRPDGEVLIQTFRPQAMPVIMAAENRIEDFYNTDIEQRRLQGFPPHTRLFRIIIRGKKADRVRTHAEKLAGLLHRHIKKSFGHQKIMGPAECPVGMISGNYRQHILVITQSFDQTHADISAMLCNTPPSGIRVEIDVDPLDLL